MSWIKRVLGRGPAPDADADLSCSFCGLHRRHVRKLVAGPRVFICDVCIDLCDQILDDEATKAGEVSRHAEALHSALIALGPRAPYARVRPMLRAAIELGRRHRPFLRRSMELAVALDDLDSAVAALRAIAPADREPVDAIDLGGLLVDLGHPDEALAALATIEPPAPPDVLAILHALHAIEARLARGDLDPAALAALRGQVTDLGPAAEALADGALADGVRARRLSAMTLAALAAGSLDAAEQAARAHLAARRGSPVAHDRLARALDARGDHAGAATVRATGLALTHPEGVFAARLQPSAAARPFR